MTADSVGSGPAQDTPITVFWRPGCGFCGSLLRRLEAVELRFDRENIWEDEAAAAFVREVAHGNETVPTVRVGNVALVNPSADEVLRAVAEVAPAHVPDGYEPPAPGRMSRAVTRLLGGDSEA